MTVVINGTTGISTPGLSNSSTTTNTGNVTNSGTVTNASTISVGNATPSSSGAGITFPATQSASSDANTLDDYEEGSWSPYFAFTATQQPVGAYQSARYVKVGRLVHVSGIVSVGTKTGATGTVYLTTLPFPVDSQASYYGGFAFGIYNAITLPAGTGIFGETTPNGTSVTLFYGSGSTTSSLQQTALSNNAYVEFSFSYSASA